MKRLMVFAVILLIPALVFAQAQTTGRVKGKVVDEEGNPVAGARVTFVSSALQGERVVKTADNGTFLATLLPIGPYAVEVSAPNMQPQQLSFRLGLGQTVPLNVTLKTGDAIVEEVTVYSTATPLETTALGENFDYSGTVEELPINNRDIEAVATYAPNIQFGPTPGTLSIGGAPSFDTVVLLDGAEVSDPYFGSAPDLYLEDAVEEVQVLTSGVSARYGRFQGGVINAITKTGGNTFDGAVRAEFDKESWNAQTPFGETQADDLNKFYQGTLGGYMIKDRLWFFAGITEIPATSTANTTAVAQPPASFTTQAEEERWQVKVRGAITPDHIVEANYLDYERTQSNRAGLPAGNIQASNGVRTDPRTIKGATYQGVLTPNFFVDFQWTDKEVSIASGGDPAAGDPFFDFAEGAVFNNHWWDITDASVRDNTTYGLNLTQALSTGDWGSHTLEYGVQMVESQTGGENRQSSTGFNYLAVPLDLDPNDDGYAWDDSAPFWGGTNASGEDVYNVVSLGSGVCGGLCQVNYRWEALPLGGAQEIKNLAFYAQDTWEFGKWRFDIGARYDDYDGSGPLPQFGLSFSDVAPRLGVTYNIDQNWQVQTTWGKYVSRFNDGVAGEATGVSSAPRLETLYTGPDCWASGFDPMSGAPNSAAVDPDGDGCDADDIAAILRNDAYWTIFTFVNDPTQPSTFVQTDIEAPHANDFNFAVKRALPRNTGSVTFTYTNREFKDLIDDFEGEICDYDIDFGQSCPSGNTTDIFDPTGALITTVDSIVWGNASQAQRQYEAFTVTADYRPSANWYVGGNLTKSETTGNYEGEGRNTPSSGSAIGDHVRGRPDNAAVPFGLLDEDIKYRARTWGGYRFNFDKAGSLAIGSVLTFQSGQVWSNTATVSRNGIPEYFSQGGSYTHYFNGRGNNRFNSWWRMDLSARYQFPIWKDLNGWLKISATNVLDNDELVSYQTSGVAVDDNGTLTWQPAGSCGLNDMPSATACSAFGRIRNEGDYQTPRTYLATFGLTF